MIQLHPTINPVHDLRIGEAIAASPHNFTISDDLYVINALLDSLITGRNAVLKTRCAVIFFLVQVIGLCINVNIPLLFRSGCETTRKVKPALDCVELVCIDVKTWVSEIL